MASTTNRIYVADIDRTELVRALWKNAKPAAFFESSELAPTLNEKELDKEVARGKKIDYLSGRAIKINFQGDSVDPSEYDKYNGQGSFQKVVDVLKSGKTIANSVKTKCEFVPWGKTLNPEDEGMVICKRCGFLKKQHF